MSTKAENIANLTSCWNRAADNEPVFVLRANDPVAQIAVHMWALHYVEKKGGWEKMTYAQKCKFHDAMAVSQAMEDWRTKVDIPF